MLRSILFLILMVSAGCASGETARRGAPADMTTITVSAAGETRDALVDQPASLAGSRAPVVLIFHGGGGSASWMVGKSKPLADRLKANGYVVVYMNGSARRDGQMLRTWNADHCCSYAQKQDVDDAAYVDAVIARLNQDGISLPGQVFLLGHSNGAMLSYRIAGELKVPPRGIVAINGGMFADQPAIPARTSVFTLHTRDDEVVSFDGSEDKSERWRTAPHLSFPDVEARLVDLKSCGPAHIAMPSPTVGVHTHECAGGSRVVAVDSSRGGHEWPKNIPGFDANGAIVDFLNASL